MHAGRGIFPINFLFFLGNAMAYSIRNAANVVLELLKKVDVHVDKNEVVSLRENGQANICGFDCKIVNVLSLNSCRVLVNKSWFFSNWPNYSKPSMKQGFNNPEIDFQLVPTRNKLFALHYLDLRHYVFLLEQEREHWFKQSYWGMQIDEQKEIFTWSGGNTKVFPLIKVQGCDDLRKRHGKLLNIAKGKTVF